VSWKDSLNVPVSSQGEWSAKRFYGDPKLAAEFLPVAYALLGQVKNRMAYGDVGYSHQRIELPNGVIIRVSRNGEQNILEIDVSPLLLTEEFITQTAFGFAFLPKDRTERRGWVIIATENGPQASHAEPYPIPFDGIPELEIDYAGVGVLVYGVRGEENVLRTSGDGESLSVTLGTGRTTVFGNNFCFDGTSVYSFFFSPHGDLCITPYVGNFYNPFLQEVIIWSIPFSSLFIPRWVFKNGGYYKKFPKHYVIGATKHKESGVEYAILLDLLLYRVFVAHLPSGIIVHSETLSTFVYNKAYISHSGGQFALITYAASQSFVRLYDVSIKVFEDGSFEFSVSGRVYETYTYKDEIEKIVDSKDVNKINNQFAGFAKGQLEITCRDWPEETLKYIYDHTEIIEAYEETTYRNTATGESPIAVIFNPNDEILVVTSRMDYEYISVTKKAQDARYHHFPVKLRTFNGSSLGVNWCPLDPITMQPWLTQWGYGLDSFQDRYSSTVIKIKHHVDFVIGGEVVINALSAESYFEIKEGIVLTRYIDRKTSSLTYKNSYTNVNNNSDIKGKGFTYANFYDDVFMYVENYVVADMWYKKEKREGFSLTATVLISDTFDGHKKVTEKHSYNIQNESNSLFDITHSAEVSEDLKEPSGITMVPILNRIDPRLAPGKYSKEFMVRLLIASRVVWYGSATIDRRINIDKLPEEQKGRFKKFIVTRFKEKHPFVIDFEFNFVHIGWDLALIKIADITENHYIHVSSFDTDDTDMGFKNDLPVIPKREHMYLTPVGLF
jgi:hypothetical protein